MAQCVGLKRFASSESLRAEHAFDGMGPPRSKAKIMDSAGMLLDMLNELALCLELGSAFIMGTCISAANG